MRVLPSQKIYLPGLQPTVSAQCDNLVSEKTCHSSVWLYSVCVCVCVYVWDSYCKDLVFLYLSLGAYQRAATFEGVTVRWCLKVSVSSQSGGSDFIWGECFLNRKIHIWLSAYLTKEPKKNPQKQLMEPVWMDTCLLWERPGRADVEHFWHVLWVALLSYIT